MAASLRHGHVDSPYTIEGDALDAAVGHARETVPAECCGLLVGRGDQILKAVRARNLHEGLDRFLIDPRAHIDALRDARAAGLEVLGFYHSHPHSMARPSRADLEEAAYPDHVHMIIGLESEEADVRLYAMAEGAYTEIGLVRVNRIVSE